MINGLKSGTIGFVFGIAVAAVAAQAAQPAQHKHLSTPSAQAVPSDSMGQMHKMMADPAKRQEMMARMAQCRDMMSMMMEHMKHEGMMMEDKPAPHH